MLNIDRNKGKKMTSIITKNQTDAMTVLMTSCLSNMFKETQRVDHWARAIARAGVVSVEDLIVAGWTRTEAEKTFGELVAKGLIHREIKSRGDSEASDHINSARRSKGSVFSLTGDLDKFLFMELEKKKSTSAEKI